MILPILSYGSSVLKRKAQEVDFSNPNLKKHIVDMWETMYAASGVGIAAPQVGLSLRLFLVDGTPFYEDDQIEDNFKYQLKNLKKVFINPEIIETGNKWSFNEGCLSIPDIREEIYRKEKIEIKYFDENFILRKEKFSGLAARIIQHEFDHIEGVLFTDRLSSLKKKMLNGKLVDISKGKVKVNYLMKFPIIRKK